MFAQSVIGGMKGATTRVVLEDAHGDQRSRVVIQRDVAFVQIAEQFGENAAEVLDALSDLDVDETPPVDLMATAQNWQEKFGERVADGS